MNYKICYQLAKSEQLIKLLVGAKEVSEGVETVKIIYQLIDAADAIWNPMLNPGSVVDNNAELDGDRNRNMILCGPSAC